MFNRTKTYVDFRYEGTRCCLEIYEAITAMMDVITAATATATAAAAAAAAAAATVTPIRCFITVISPVRSVTRKFSRHGFCDYKNLSTIRIFILRR